MGYLPDFNKTLEILNKFFFVIKINEGQPVITLNIFNCNFKN